MRRNGHCSGAHGLSSSRSRCLTHNNVVAFTSASMLLVRLFLLSTSAERFSKTFDKGQERLHTGSVSTHALCTKEAKGRYKYRDSRPVIVCNCSCYFRCPNRERRDGGRTIVEDDGILRSFVGKLRSKVKCTIFHRSPERIAELKQEL